MKYPIISVIISTYNQPEWLEKTLWGYQTQTYKKFEVIIADDGSGEETKILINTIQKEVFYAITHIWQEDDGFQKSRILNKAILACNAAYLVMSDGDCIPRADFLEIHNSRRKEGYFLSGGYVMLPMNISEIISKEDILQRRCFDIGWLSQNGLTPSFKNKKLTVSGFKAWLLNTITPTRASWNGHNASGWKKDIIGVNGFDERMQYGGQDRELGERLLNYGIKSKQIRYSAICIHLEHPRGYKTPESMNKNKQMRKMTRSKGLTWTPYGINKEAP